MAIVTVIILTIIKYDCLHHKSIMIALINHKNGYDDRNHNDVCNNHMKQEISSSYGYDNHNSPILLPQPQFMIPLTIPKN